MKQPGAGWTELLSGLARRTVTAARSTVLVPPVAALCDGGVLVGPVVEVRLEEAPVR
jgi:hypothetical protein